MLSREDNELICRTGPETQKSSALRATEIEIVRMCGRATAECFQPPGWRTRDSGKEVIQPQVPLRLPCYDFAPVTALAFGRSAP